MKLSWYLSEPDVIVICMPEMKKITKQGNINTYKSQ